MQASDVSGLVDSLSGLSLSERYVKKVTNVHQDDVHALVQLPGGEIVSGSKDTTIAIWNTHLDCLKRLNPAPRGNYEHWVTALAVFPNGSFISGSRKGMLYFWSADYRLLSQKSVQQWVKNGGGHVCKERNRVRINCLQPIPNSNNLFLAGLPTKIQTWNSARSQRYNEAVVSQNDWLYCIKPLLEHKFALIIGSDIAVWENKTDNGRSWYFAPKETVYHENPEEVVGRQRPHIASAEFIDDTVLALALFSGHVKLFDLNECRVASSIKGHEGRVWTVCPMGPNTVISGADDQVVKVWDVRMSSCVHTFGKHSGRVSNVLQLGENQIIAAACPSDPYASEEKASFTIWDVRV